MARGRAESSDPKVPAANKKRESLPFLRKSRENIEEAGKHILYLPEGLLSRFYLRQILAKCLIGQLITLMPKLKRAMMI